MSHVSKSLSLNIATKLVIYIAVAYWMINMFQMVSEPRLPWSLVLLHPPFFVHLAFGGVLFVAIWRIAED